MSEAQAIKERLAALERDVATLKSRLETPTNRHWLDAFDGTFADEPAFDEVIRYGRELRQADRPSDSNSSDS